VDIWPVDREGAFVLPDNHWHLSANGIFLPTTGDDDKRTDQQHNDGEEVRLRTLYAAVKSCEVL